MVLTLCACAQGGRDMTIDANGGIVDAPKQQMDAPMVDVPPGTMTRELTQTTSQALAAQASIVMSRPPCAQAQSVSTTAPPLGTPIGRDTN